MNNENTQRDPAGQQEQQAFVKQRAEVDLSIEEVLLLLFGVFAVLYGLLLFPVLKGAIRYSLDSADGLFLVIVSLQVITMGKTPFSDLRRSWILVIVGIASAMLGSFAIFIPGSLTVPVSILTGVILVVGGVSQLVQLFISEEKAKTWMKVPGILQHLTIACGLVWALGVLLGILTLMGVVVGNVVIVPGNPAGPLAAVLILIFGLSFFYLTWCVQKATRLYPPQETKNSAREQMTSENPHSQAGLSLFREASLSLTDAFGLFRGVLITFLGLLYYGVYFGGIPLNQSGRLGLLLILTSLILLWEGSFLGRQYRRSWWLMTIGIVFAGMGIVSCIVPGILADVIQPLLGVQNIFTGGLFLALQLVVPAVYGTRSPPAEPVTLPPLMKRLGHSSTVLNIVLIVFGLDALAPVLLPSLLGVFGYDLFFPVLIITVGLLNLYMTYLNQKLQ